MPFTSQLDITICGFKFFCETSAPSFVRRSPTLWNTFAPQGYSIEIALKHKICKTLNWASFPSSNREFENYRSVKTHDIDVLLSFTGIDTTLKITYFAEWSAISIWNPEARYHPIGMIDPDKASRMIKSAKTLIGII